MKYTTVDFASTMLTTMEAFWDIPDTLPATVTVLVKSISSVFQETFLSSVVSPILTVTVSGRMGATPATVLTGSQGCTSARL